MIKPVSATEIAVSGLKAQRTRINVIANNIANAQTTRTPEGGAFRRQLVVFRGEQMHRGYSPEKLGVRVKEIEQSNDPLREVYDPSHPDANDEGYVSYPNINLAVEMANLVSAQRAYEANIAVVLTGSTMHEAALNILQR